MYMKGAYFPPYFLKKELLVSLLRTDKPVRIYSWLYLRAPSPDEEKIL